MEFDKLLKARYSCRKFSGKAVDPALVDEIIEAGRLAPTAVNRQPFKVFRMESAEAREAVRQCTSCTFGAGTFLVIGARAEDGWVRPFDGRPFSDVDAAIAATHMLLKIADLGLGSTWVGWFDAPKLRELCPAMKGYDLVALFPIGWPAEDAEPALKHYTRKSTEEVSEVL